MSGVIATEDGTSAPEPIVQKGGRQSLLVAAPAAAGSVVSAGAPASPGVLCLHPSHSPAVVAVQARAPQLLTVHNRLETGVLAAGLRGPAGLQGIPGPAGGTAFARTAGEILSALRVVYEIDQEVFYLDPDDEDHIDLLLGITLTAADIGTQVNVQRYGVIEDSAWNWSLGRVWLGANGTLTQTPPLFGFDVLIGYAVSPTRITLNIQDPIHLEE